MARLVYGERIGAQAKLSVGCSALLFDEARERILLTRRADNGRWCLPGGHMEPGESVTEACAREMWEETGLHVQVGRLVGVYSTPHRILEYADGNRVHLVALHFEVEVTGGTLGLSNETTEFAYFTPAEIEALDLMDHHRERIADTLASQSTTFVR